MLFFQEGLSLRGSQHYEGNASFVLKMAVCGFKSPSVISPDLRRCVKRRWRQLGRVIDWEFIFPQNCIPVLKIHIRLQNISRALCHQPNLLCLVDMSRQNLLYRLPYMDCTARTYGSARTTQQSASDSKLQFLKRLWNC